MTIDEKNEMCNNCRTRKAYARKFDEHFDWVDCPYKCEASKKEPERFDSESIDRAIESAKGRIYYIKENTSPDCGHTHWIKANNQIELMNITVSALERMKPKKPIYGETADCWFCGQSVTWLDKYCPECGQHIDWEE